MKKLSHENVIKLVEVFEDTDKQKLYPYILYTLLLYECLIDFFSLTIAYTYVVLEYCVGGLQEMLDKAPGNKFPVWQAHKWVVHKPKCTS